MSKIILTFAVFRSFLLLIKRYLFTNKFMRTKLLYLFSMFCMLGVFVACSDDDKVQPIGEVYNGVYKGTLDIELSGTQVGKDIPQKVYITKVGDTQIKMELKNFSFGTLALGTIMVEKCDVIKNDGSSCAFNGEQKITIPEIGDCNVKLEGSIVGDKIDMDIEVAATQNGTPIEVKVDFDGTKLAADQSSEAAITGVTFETNLVTAQPVIEGNNITFSVSDTISAEELAALTPTIVVSPGAKLSPESGVPQDFTHPVTYTVTSEDGIFTTTYSISVAEKKAVYDFETWVAGNEGQDPEMTFYEVAGGWSSSNTGAHFLKAFGMADRYVVSATEDAHSGKLAASIQSIDTKGRNMGIAIVPKVTTGSLFLGKFITNLSNTLNSTKFGNEYHAKPVSFRGFYKYTPGEVFYRCESPKTCDKAVEDPNSVDQCAINAVLYEVTDFADESQYLTGMDIKTSDRIIATAKLEDGSAKADWTSFEIPFTYTKEYDANKKYRFAVMCSSSSDGDNFNGAPGSTLIVDDIEVIVE